MHCAFGEATVPFYRHRRNHCALCIMHSAFGEATDAPHSVNNKYNCTPIPIYVYIKRTRLHNPCMIFKSINIYKSCSSVQLYTSCTQITRFCEQPEQLNRDSIYICVYTHSLFIPFRRFYIFKNNKILFTCSVVHSPTPGNHPFHPFL